MQFLFICKGNVGRSQMAEALFRKFTLNKIEVSSAGIKLNGPNQPLTELLPRLQPVFDVMKEEGIDMSSKI